MKIENEYFENPIKILINNDIDRYIQQLYD